ncbi:hypothetical protein [Mycobacterium sp. M26]|uniref:hypothetical protein n=1 Tax=Mycobacterium sp. M26 TaxID=1762962 RepID=UPI00073E6610|nr:hypothetical protein [Mycobacterium sp. M26]
MNLLTAEVDAPVDAPSAQTIHTLFVIPELPTVTVAEAPADTAVAEVADETEASDEVEDAPEPSFHLSTQMILAVILTSVILTALAVTAVASFAPQGFSAGT